MLPSNLLRKSKKNSNDQKLDIVQGPPYGLIHQDDSPKQFLLSRFPPSLSPYHMIPVKHTAIYVGISVVGSQCVGLRIGARGAHSQRCIS